MILTRLKQIAKHSFVYSLSYVATSAAGLLLLPIYTQYLSRSDYGTISLVDQSIYYIKILFFLGGSSAVTRFYNHYQAARDRRSVITSGLSLALFGSGTGSALLIAFAVPLATMVFGDPEYFRLVYAAAAILTAESILSVSMAFFSAERRPRTYVAYGLIQLAFGIIANLTLIVVFRLGAAGMVYGQALSNVLVCVVVTAHVLAQNMAAPERRHVAELIRFGVPLVPATVFAAIMHSADQYLIRYYCGLSDVGIYSLGYKLAFSTYSLLSVSIGLVWSSAMMYEIAAEPNAKSTFGRIATYVTSLYIVVLFCVSVFSSVIVRVLAAPAYYPAHKVIPLVAIGLVPYSLQTFLSVGVILKNRTWLFPLTNGVAAICNMGLNLLLIPDYGYLGAAWASIVTYIVFALTSWCIYRRTYDVPLEWKRLGLLLSVCVLLYSLAAMLPTNGLVAATALDTVVCLSLPVILAIGGFFTKDEWQQLRSWRATLREAYVGHSRRG